MSGTNIRALKHRHQRRTILVVASGASVDHIRSEFFLPWPVVAVNEMFRHITRMTINGEGPGSYAVMHHHEHAQEVIDHPMWTAVLSERDWGFRGWGTETHFSGHYYTYRTDDNRLSLPPTIDVAALEHPQDDALVVSACTASEAIQFAAHLTGSGGTILLCGVDGAALDGRWCFQGYNEGRSTNPQHVRLTWPILMATVAAVRRRGIGVYALNPFIGPDLEGHQYEPAPVLNGRRLLQALRTDNIEATADALV